MNNFNPYFNTINMTRNISPFATAGSSSLNGISQAAKTGGLFTKIGGSKITLSNILNGAQKTIGTVNQIVPLYNQVKPMFQNSKILLNVAKSLKSDKSTTSQKTFKNRRNRPIYNQNTTTTQQKEEIKKEKQKENTPSKPFFV